MSTHLERVSKTPVILILMLCFMLCVLNFDGVATALLYCTLMTVTVEDDSV